MTPARARALAIAALYLPLVTVGGYVGWKAAPDAESALFPPVIDMRFVPFDPARPDVLFERRADRTCWRLHFHKARSLLPLRRAVTWVLPSGARYYTESVNAATGFSSNSLDVKPAGYTGEVANCSIMPDNFDGARGYDIELYAQYEPPHRLWPVEETFPVIHLPAIGDAP